METTNVRHAGLLEGDACPVRVRQPIIDWGVKEIRAFLYDLLTTFHLIPHPFPLPTSPVLLINTPPWKKHLGQWLKPPQTATLFPCCHEFIPPSASGLRRKNSKKYAKLAQGLWGVGKLQANSALCGETWLRYSKTKWNLLNSCLVLVLSSKKATVKHTTASKSGGKSGDAI